MGGADFVPELVTDVRTWVVVGLTAVMTTIIGVIGVNIIENMC